MTIACGVAAPLALAAFALVERRAREPLVDLSFFADAAFRVPMLALLASFVALFTAVFLVPFYLERTAGLTPGPPAPLAASGRCIQAPASTYMMRRR